MKKKSKISMFLVSLILLISICCFLIFYFIKELNTYSNVIESNWKIELPSKYKEIYSCDSGESFLGDGVRYHVFQYKDNSYIDKILNWKSDKNTVIESDVNTLLSALNIDSVYSPNFEEKYRYHFQKDMMDSSKLYIIYYEHKSVIYIIENFQ